MKVFLINAVNLLTNGTCVDIESFVFATRDQNEDGTWTYHFKDNTFPHVLFEEDMIHGKYIQEVPLVTDYQYPDDDWKMAIHEYFRREHQMFYEEREDGLLMRIREVTM